MKERVEELVTHIQERCLWQFFSRSWDREENIEAILSKTADVLAGEAPSTETQADRCWAADAKILASDFRSQHPWLKDAGKQEIRDVIDGVKARMREIAVEKSKNGELHVTNY
jgi:nitrogenase delta subunit